MNGLEKMRYKIGDLLIYNPSNEANLEPLDFGAYWMLVNEYGRPWVLEEAGNIGIVIDLYPSSQVFLKTNQNHNMYVWRSQQTDREYIIFQIELTTPEKYAKMGSYLDSFVADPFKKKHKKK